MSEREIACSDLNVAIDDLRSQGFRLDLIYPADDPHTATLSRQGDCVRVTRRPEEPPPSDLLPPFAPDFVLTVAGALPGQGRAGMLYRDLVPGRLGGRYIASHISIPKGGPVADWVHFHRISLQMIYVRRGWIRVVYEDQGEPFVMHEGDIVLQPPEIRHQVLESSPGLEVIEIGSPALHATFAEHRFELPNGRNPRRTFAGQRFLHHIGAKAPWTSFNGCEVQETAIGEATGGLLEVRTIRSAETATAAFLPHQGELVFGFVLEGSATLEFRGSHKIGAADAFVIPPDRRWGLGDISTDLRLLHVTTTRLD
ncbi:MAG TPA: cupin domain-containing protein [Sphingomicrobium sp.]|nr:cupin domain-containing protein [Sphingomicrobium sp.]